MGIKNPRKYTNEFKHRVITLANEIGVTEASNKLGVPTANVYNWRESLTKAGRVSKSDTKSASETSDEELKRLRKENFCEFGYPNQDDYETVFERNFCKGTSAHFKKSELHNALRLTDVFQFSKNSERKTSAISH